MKQHPYTIWDSAPMKYHKFLIYFYLPVSICLLLMRFLYVAISLSTSDENLISFLMIDIVFYFIIAATAIATRYYMVRRKWRGVLLLFVFHAINLIYEIICIYISYQFGYGTDFIVSNVSTLVVSILYPILLGVYYSKRRMLFLPIPIMATVHMPEHDNAAKPSEDPWEHDGAVQQHRHVYGPLDPPERKTIGRAPLWVTAVLGALCLVLAILCVIEWSNTTYLTSKNVELKTQIAGKDALIKTNRNIINKYRSTVSEQSTKIRDMKAEISMMEYELSFWQRSAVIVTESGRKYHHYGCPHIAGRDYWIYNISLAEYYGYKPCLDCFD